jgi:flagellar motor switch protein FliN/FliY
MSDPTAMGGGGTPPGQPSDPLADLGGAADPFGGMDQASIDELLKQASFDDPALAATTAPATTSAPARPALDPSAHAAAAAAAAAIADLPDTSPMKLPDFQQVMNDAQVSSIDLLRDVDLNVKIELGRSRMLVEDVLKLAEGAVVELDKLAGDPVDVFVNDRLVARGEVLVLNDNFCVRINEIMAGVKEEGL